MPQQLGSHVGRRQSAPPKPEATLVCGKPSHLLIHLLLPQMRSHSTCLLAMPMIRLVGHCHPQARQSGCSLPVGGSWGVQECIPKDPMRKPTGELGQVLLLPSRLLQKELNLKREEPGPVADVTHWACVSSLSAATSAIPHLWPPLSS